MEITAQKGNESVTSNLIALLITILTVALALRFYVAAQTDKTGYSWLWMLSAIQLLPFILGVILKSQNYLNFILLSHFMGFSLAKFNQDQNLSKSFALSKSWIIATQELAICTAILAATYYLARFVVIPQTLRRRPFNDLTLSETQLRIILLYIVLIPFLSEILPYQLRIIHFAMSSAQMLMIICAQSPGNEKLLLMGRIAIPTLAFVSFLLFGFLSMFGSYVSFLLFYSFMTNKRSYLLPILCLTLLLSAIQSVKNDFRLYLSASGYETSLLDRASVLWTLLENQYFNGEAKEESDAVRKDEESESALMRGFSRVGDDSLERVLAMTPSIVPFWEGETYQSIPYMFIPRFLWADKPGRHFWNKFGRAYHILSEDDVQTSVGVGFLAEAYMNFGFAWMYLIAGFMGIFLVLLERLSMSLLRDKFYFPYVAIMGPLIGLGADLGSIINSTVILTACFVLARPFLLRLARRDDYSF